MRSVLLPHLSLSLYYPSFLFLTGTQVLGNFLFLSICLPIGVSYLTFYLCAPLSLLSLYSFPPLSFSPSVCYMCGKNRWLFPLRCHQWGLIYDAHRVENPIKSLFTVKRQDHQKQWRCFNCCWHQLNVMRPHIPMYTWAGVNKQLKAIWKSFCEFMFCIPPN